MIQLIELNNALRNLALQIETNRYELEALKQRVETLAALIHDEIIGADQKTRNIYARLDAIQPIIPPSQNPP